MAFLEYTLCTQKIQDGSRTQESQEQVANMRVELDLLTPKTKKRKTEELKGNNTLKEIEKVGLGLGHPSCKIVDVKTLNKLNWFYFFDKNENYSFYQMPPCLRVSSLP